ncbi:hypothetical protein BCEP4_590005 [Burkholderia cepacia]|nr:hypothetical protein BCEP4_590005 [Burkholderia cepacia]
MSNRNLPRPTVTSDTQNHAHIWISIHHNSRLPDIHNLCDRNISICSRDTNPHLIEKHVNCNKHRNYCKYNY